MDYLLIVLTHGGDTLRRCVESFEEMVTPPPASAVLIDDGSPPLPPWDLWTRERVHTGAVGFCEAVRAGWAEAARSEHEWVFWLEHDFLIKQPIDLRELAAVLRKNAHLAQMALMRHAVNQDEIGRGGVLAGREHQRASDFLTGADWIEHDHWWTTNPSLFRADLARMWPWPEGPGCEGKFGIDLRSAGFHFGVWGHGEPQVEHIGTRTGKGY